MAGVVETSPNVLRRGRRSATGTNLLDRFGFVVFWVRGSDADEWKGDGEMAGAGTISADAHTESGIAEKVGKANFRSKKAGPPFEEMEDAIWSGNQAKISDLIKNGVDLNQKTKGLVGLTALHLAAQKSDPKIVKVLIEKGKMDPNVRDGNGFVPIYDLCADHHLRDADKNCVVKCFDILCKSGADVNANDNEWEMSLIEKAVFESNPHMVKALVSAGANLEPKKVMVDGKAGNLVHLAVRSENLDIVKLMICKIGVSRANELTESGLTALDLAEESMSMGVRHCEIEEIRNYHDIVAFLIGKGCKRSPERARSLP